MRRTVQYRLLSKAGRLPAAEEGSAKSQQSTLARYENVQVMYNIVSAFNLEGSTRSCPSLVSLWESDVNTGPVLVGMAIALSSLWVKSERRVSNVKASKENSIARVLLV